METLATLPLVNAAADEFLCVRCARHRQTCCQISEIFVTRGDVRRIEDHTGQRDFHEFRPPANPEYLHEDEDDDPTWRNNVFQSDGTRRVLKKQASGDCTFLGAAGCLLPLETRPLICRIYPFDYTEAGLLDDLAPGCPLELLPPGQGLIDALDMNRADAERWRRQLYEELAVERLSENAMTDEPPKARAVSRSG